MSKVDFVPFHTFTTFHMSFDAILFYGFLAKQCQRQMILTGAIVASLYSHDVGHLFEFKQQKNKIVISNFEQWFTTYTKCYSSQ